MTADPRAALARLIAAFEAHLRALEQDDDAAVERAYDILATAYEAYDEALGETFDESTPLDFADDAYDDDDDDDDSDDDDDDDDSDDDEDYEDDFDADDLEDDDIEILTKD